MEQLSETLRTGRSGRVRSRALELLSRIDPKTAALVFAVVSAITLVSVTTPLAVTLYEVPLVVAFALALAHGAALPLAVFRPGTAVVLSVATSVLLQALSAQADFPVWPWWAPLMISESIVLFLVALRGSWELAASAWFLASAAPAILGAILRPDRADPTSINLVIFASLSGGLIILGIVLAQWSRIRSQLLRERSISVEEHSRRVLAEDRARIAREVHDVIAHGLSIINVQSMTAPYRNPDMGAAAQAEFAEIAASSRQALGEMRNLLGILRDDSPSTTAPQPKVSDIPDLVAQAARAGTAVTLNADDDVASGVSDVVGLVAYRIVQEALSNAIRHAPGASVSVSVRQIGENLIVTVENSPGQSAAHGGGSGFGLVGMRERASSVSGSVTTDTRPGGGFVVRAVLPKTSAAVTE